MAAGCALVAQHPPASCFNVSAPKSELPLRVSSAKRSQISNRSCCLLTSSTAVQGAVWHSGRAER